MLYQQGTQRIEIIVRKESNGQDGAKENDTENVSSNGTQNDTQKSGGLTARQKRIVKTNLTHALAVTKQVVDLGVEYYVSGIGQRNGDQALQDQVSRNVEIVKDVTGFASSVAMGALYGSWGGPVGAVLGATFGAISTGASTFVKYANREREFNFKMFKENNAIEYQRARAGINLTTGRLR
ncbi:MAG: hypothetical protein IJF83_01320 [Methanobrevibacter sp.]|nr:hypothetical protein [Methanobrevibacter sp.]